MTRQLDLWTICHNDYVPLNLRIGSPDTIRQYGFSLNDFAESLGRCCQAALNFDQSLAGSVVACPYCGQQINVNVPVTQQPIKAQPYIPQEQPVVYSRPRRRRSESHPGIAALLSFFIVGAGQMYAGNVLGGMAFFLLWVFMLVAAIPTLGISLIFAFVLWVASVFLAYTDALGSQRD